MLILNMMTMNSTSITYFFYLDIWLCRYTSLQSEEMKMKRRCDKAMRKEQRRLKREERQRMREEQEEMKGIDELIEAPNLYFHVFKYLC